MSDESEEYEIRLKWQALCTFCGSVTKSGKFFAAVEIPHAIHVSKCENCEEYTPQSITITPTEVLYFE